MSKTRWWTRLRCLPGAAAVAACAAILTPPAGAADLPIKAAPSIPLAAYWAGVYVGAHGGWGWSATYVEDPQFNPTYTPLVGYGDGPLAGGQLGVNRQNGNFVYGLELDGSWAGVRGYNTQTPTVIFPNAGSIMDFRALATATVRAGYAAGPWLFYGKAGGAYANLRLTTDFTAAGPQEVIRDRFGAAAGAGLEVAFLRNVSAKLEYNFLYFPADHFQYVGPHTTSSMDNSVQVMKAGINVHFGGERGYPR